MPIILSMQDMPYGTATEGQGQQDGGRSCHGTQEVLIQFKSAMVDSRILIIGKAL